MITITKYLQRKHIVRNSFSLVTVEEDRLIICSQTLEVYGQLEVASLLGEISEPITHTSTNLWKLDE
jgi:hypothetical protein